MLSSKRSSRGFVHRPLRSSMPWILFLFMSLFPSKSIVTAGYVAHEDASIRYAVRELHLTITNLQHLARIANAAYVQTEISSRTLSTETFLGEILHLEDIWPNDIASIDESQFDEVVKDLMDLSKNLPTSKEATEIENRLVLLEGMGKNAEYFKTFAEFPGKDEFKTELAKVEDVKSSGYDKLKGAAYSFQVNFKSAKGLPRKVDANNVDQAVYKLGAILGNLYDLENRGKNFETDKLKEAKTFGKRSNFLDLLLAEHENRIQLNGFVYDSQPVTTVWKNFENLTATSKKVGKFFKAFKVLKSIIATRNKGYSQFFRYTSGFPSGTSDLEGLTDSINQKFIREHVPRSYLVIDKLKSSFDPFIPLSKTLEDLEKVWSTVLEHNEINITGYISRVEKVASVSKELESITEYAEKLKKCHESVGAFPMRPIKPVEVMWNSINNLTIALQSVTDFDYISDFKNLTSLKFNFDYRGKTPEETIKIVQKALEELDSPRMKELEGKVAKLHEDLENLEKVMKLYGTLSFDLAEVEAHHDNVKTGSNHLDIYPCLAKVSSKTRNPIKTAFEAIHEIREFSMSSELQNAFKEFIKSREHMPIIKSAAEKLKNIEDRDKSILVNTFKNQKYLKASENLGKGVQGLVVIEKMYAARDKLSQTQMRELSKLENLRQVFKGIDNFLQKKFVDFRRRKVGCFETFTEVFEEAAKFGRVRIDPSHLPPYFDELKNLDLDFSSYHFKDAGDALIVMDEFFAEFSERLLPVVSVSSDTRKAFPPPSPKEMNAFERYYQEHAVDFWQFIFFMICIIITVVVIICCRRRGNCKMD